jgi:phosphohistidine phosphatase SixA
LKFSTPLSPSRIFYTGMALLALMLVVAAFYYYRNPDGVCPNVISDRVLREQVQKLWREGRVDVLLRHTDRCTKDEPCPEEQGLTPKGERQAKLIGRGMQTLFDDNFELLSSDVDRARYTAQLAFSRSPTMVRWLREDCVNDLKSRLQKPREGNLVMATHSTCLAALTNDQGEKLTPFGRANMPYGLAVFLARAPEGGMPQLLGCATPNDWSGLHLP